MPRPKPTRRPIAPVVKQSMSPDLSPFRKQVSRGLCKSKEHRSVSGILEQPRDLFWHIVPDVLTRLVWCLCRQFQLLGFPVLWRCWWRFRTPISGCGMVFQPLVSVPAAPAPVTVPRCPLDHEVAASALLVTASLRPGSGLWDIVSLRNHVINTPVHVGLGLMAWSLSLGFSSSAPSVALDL